LPAVRASNAPVELALDLFATPPDKVLARIFGALERVSAEVTLLVYLRDTPEYVGVAASVYQALRGRGYASDTSRLPGGGQRLRIRWRHENQRHTPRFGPTSEVAFVPPPATDFPLPPEPAELPAATETLPGTDTAKMERTDPPPAGASQEGPSSAIEGPL
jgi:hypothetical protein